MGVDRLLSIILIISNRGMVTAKELADHFEVSVRTIYRDMDKISQGGIPIAANGGSGGGYFLLDNYSVDNLHFNKGEYRTLMTVMDSLNIVFGMNQQFNDIMMKFKNKEDNEQQNSDNLRINMSHFSMGDELKSYLSIMSTAIEDSKLLVFHYINRNMEYTIRTVEPIRIEYFSGQWYLTGYCRNRNDYRKFKLVRIKNLIFGEIYQPKRLLSDDELQEIFNRSYDKNGIEVKLKFSYPIGEQLTEYFNKESIRYTEDNCFIVDDVFPYEEGLYKFLLGFGKECEVLEPDYLREDMKKYINKILGKYND